MMAQPAKSSWRARAWGWQHRAAPYLFLSPLFLLFAGFLLYPLVRSLQLSFYATLGARASRFIGLANFRFLLTDRLFWLAVANTVGYTIAFLLVQIPASLGLAMLMNARILRARSALRFAFFSTHLVGSVFAAVLFAQILSPRSGLLNRALGAVLMRPIQIDWLGRPELAMTSVLMAGLWLSIGYGMIYFLAALQSVDQELYEAATVDGAGALARFRHVTLPGIRPVLRFMVLVGTIGCFQLFELPFILFQQSSGPTHAGMTIVMFLFFRAFSIDDLGYASAIGWALVGIQLVVAIAMLRIWRGERE